MHLVKNKENRIVKLKKKLTTAHERRPFGHHILQTDKNEFLLTFMKLRLNLLNEDLGNRFQISTTTVSETLTTWLSLLSSHLVPALQFNPPKEAVGLIFIVLYQNVRYIIYCTELFVEKPKDLHLQALTWSDYEHHQTVKILVSILPNGFFNFVSKAWEDKHLTTIPHPKLWVS